MDIHQRIAQRLRARKKPRIDIPWNLLKVDLVSEMIQRGNNAAETQEIADKRQISALSCAIRMGKR
ncbi:hypothetical protein KC221_31340, partial [Mycobacterium tuberculosis]|nr:hypothetical protein [Mycobacterium tuberculosis]